MPITALGAAAITAGAQLLGTGANAYAQGKMNKKTREWNEQQYWRTRNDSLRDWAMVNEYNSPQAQMQRFRDAGLNPNLIYGQSNMSDAVRSSDVNQWNPRSPELDLSAAPALGQYFNARMQEANLRNLETINTVQQQEAILKAAQIQQTIASTESTEAGTRRQKFDLEQATGLSPYLLESARKNVEKLSAETTQLIDNNERQAALTASSLQEAIARIGAIRINNLKTQAETENQRAQKQHILSQIKAIEQGIENAKRDGTIKDETIELMKRGQNPNDPTWLRKLGEYLDKYFPTPQKFNRDVNEMFKNLKPENGNIHRRNR